MKDVEGVIRVACEVLVAFEAWDRGYKTIERGEIVKIEARPALTLANLGVVRVVDLAPEDESP